jgi:hypothetical protein
MLASRSSVMGTSRRTVIDTSRLTVAAWMVIDQRS